jgi:MarR family transcriptional regulator, organic hydroperoxide resistance regulator
MPSPDTFASTLWEWTDVFMHRSMRNFLRYSKDSGLSMSQLGALFYIRRKGTCDVSNLGDELGVTSAAVSQMIERLVQQGLILRAEDPNDRRFKQLVLTEKGQQILQESIQARQNWLNDLVSTMSDDEKNQVNAALRIMIDKTKLLA